MCGAAQMAVNSCMIKFRNYYDDIGLVKEMVPSFKFTVAFLMTNLDLYEVIFLQC